MDFILLLKKIVLAIIQGIAEILPISSSGHLLIFSNILDIDTNGMQLPIFLHFGSLVAMIIYYRKDIGNIIVSVFRYLFNNLTDKERLQICVEHVQELQKQFSGWEKDLMKEMIVLGKEKIENIK